MPIKAYLSAHKLSLLCGRMSCQLFVLFKMLGTRICVLFRHGTSELSCPWLQVHHSLPVVYLSQEPMGNLHAFAVTEICCQQACRVLGQNCFTLDTIQNGSSWRNKKSVIFFCCFLAFLRVHWKLAGVPRLSLAHRPSLPKCAVFLSLSFVFVWCPFAYSILF